MSLRRIGLYRPILFFICMTIFGIIKDMKRWILCVVPSLFIVSSCDRNDISNTFKFIITNNEGGEVFGTKSGDYSKGSTIILEASPFDGYEFLVIKVKTEVRLNTTTLPYFKKGTMYKGMEVDKEYSLEELGL